MLPLENCDARARPGGSVQEKYVVTVNKEIAQVDETPSHGRKSSRIRPQEGVWPGSAVAGGVGAHAVEPSETSRRPRMPSGLENMDELPQEAHDAESVVSPSPGPAKAVSPFRGRGR